jgi:hypothetical protein
MYEGVATKEMLQKRWRKDAEYEVRGPVGSIAHPYSSYFLTRWVHAGSLYEVQRLE